MKPYGLMADCHLHNWKAFAEINPATGMNTRLEAILSEIERCAQETKAAGGDTVYIAGDLFHVRGAVAPTVLNPVKHLFDRLIVDLGITFVILPGNHDMELRESSRIGNAVEALGGEGVIVAHQVANHGTAVIVPWMEKIADLKKALEAIPPTVKHKGNDLIIHAPIDGVIPMLPDHGLDANYLADLGFKRVFAGHYHNHKDFGNGVYSIGAIGHHTWSDVGTKAGFLIVSEDDVKWHKSHCPDFVDITPHMDETEAQLVADRNFVRVRTHSTKTAEINALRTFFEDAGAKGVVIQHVRAPVVERAPGERAATVEAGASLEESVKKYVHDSGLFTNNEQARKVDKVAQAILAEAGAA